MEAVDLIVEPAKAFVKSSIRCLKRCELPSTKIVKRTAIATGVGIAVLGTIGFIFKLASFPINNVIIGGMVNH